MSGHIIDMVNRIKQNTIPKRKKFKGNNRALMYSEKFKTGVEYSFPSISKAELQLLKSEINEKAKKDSRTTFYIFIASIIMVSLLLLLILKSL